MKLKEFILLTAMLFAISSSVLGQKRSEIKPLPENASLAETQQWLADALGKHASYKTRFDAVTLSNIKISGCTVAFTETDKRNRVSTATMGTTRTTNVSKNDIIIDLAKVRADGISLEDHIYPELQSIKIWYAGFDLAKGSTAGRIYYIVAKLEAAGAIKTALVQIQRQCKSPK
ncbi:MAG TPA: hypothetical protein VMZ26_14200 [Pyrinomonadaceae bacterium]|nr:hypothetical protein [Pyrinomonadaceae bacterium]